MKKRIIALVCFAVVLSFVFGGTGTAGRTDMQEELLKFYEENGVTYDMLVNQGWANETFFALEKELDPTAYGSMYLDDDKNLVITYAPGREDYVREMAEKFRTSKDQTIIFQQAKFTWEELQYAFDRLCELSDEEMRHYRIYSFCIIELENYVDVWIGRSAYNDETLDYIRKHVGIDCLVFVELDDLEEGTPFIIDTATSRR